MTALLDSSWFYWAIGVAVGLPVGLILLTEWQHVLVRRQSILARPVSLLRNYLLPLAALLLLLVKATEVSAEATSVRVVATVFGFVVLVMLLSGLNATVFQGAPEGSWRKRMPTIFIDVARFVLIALGLAVIFSYIWGANVGGLFTALGISSIVLGLALQNSVGQIISGLLLLFEQPFQLGDWLDTPTARGRVVEVNWRATHIDTGSGMQIMPNSMLAGASFTNLSQPASAHKIMITTTFSLVDPPDVVCAMLNRVANMLPYRKPDVAPVSVAVGGTEYRRRAAVPRRRRRRPGHVPALDLVCGPARGPAPGRGRGRVLHPGARREGAARRRTQAAADPHRPTGAGRVCHGRPLRRRRDPSAFGRSAHGHGLPRCRSGAANSDG